jgi:hypothetical protein
MKLARACCFPSRWRWERNWSRAGWCRIAGRAATTPNSRCVEARKEGTHDQLLAAGALALAPCQVARNGKLGRTWGRCTGGRLVYWLQASGGRTRHDLEAITRTTHIREEAEGRTLGRGFFYPYDSRKGINRRTKAWIRFCDTDFLCGS